QRAIVRNSDTIEGPDLDIAIKQAIEKAYQSIVSTYHRATSSSRADATFNQVLLACALCQKDELGFFTPRQVVKPMSIIMGKPYKTNGISPQLHSFCEEDKGPVLQKRGKSRKFRFRFINPMMQPYAIMYGLAHKIININQLAPLSKDI
ncbi:MAG: hypothetical protein AAFV85_19355, partial [Cyanobacteria bacterium J06634_6]